FATMIDNLKYEYNGNKLTKVTDEQQNPSGYPYIATPNTITYDANGNMITHLDKGISSIQYNYLNLPSQITQNAKVTSYTYRADGVKVKKLFGDIETNYLDGFQYKSTYTAESNLEGTPIDPDETPVLKLRIIPTSEGYYDALHGQYVYNYTDHLGNVRLSYSDYDKNGTIRPKAITETICDGPIDDPFTICYSQWQPGEIVENNNYYPFGMLHNYTATTQNAYQYKFNGKELQESGMYDFGARMYMPDLGRWGVIDPLAESYRRWSPYHYAMNNPVKFTDPDGMGSYDSEGVWHSEMEDFNNYHHINWNAHDQEYNTFKPSDEGGGGGPGITMGDLWDALFAQSEDYTPNFEQFDFEQFGAEDCCPDPAAPWFFDKKGEELMNHWLGGSGKKLSFAYDKNWTIYMSNNGFIKDELLKRAIARSYTMYSEGKTKYSETSGNFSFEIDNTYNTGYGMLHGTRYFSYVMNGKYDKSIDSYIFNFDLKWTDQINHNKNVLMDRVFNGIARSIGHPADYWITIKWTQTIIVKNKEWERLR
ncbi:RHS repeat domain-containing protein, partial [Chryseobacterium sp. Alg-005]|uniref:RHS repeat domain-containing protein n=1 Tax=Chryseobacterium sp. Alg-005 TaxID=3159516 RepID=UPI0036F19DA8